jgi:hypothetical protein
MNTMGIIITLWLGGIIGVCLVHIARIIVNKYLGWKDK